MPNMYNQSRRNCLLFPYLVCAATFLPTAIASGGEASDLLGTMYWTYRDEGIYRAARDGSELELIAPAKFADGLAVDAARETIYWTISGDGPNKVQKCKLDGSDVQDVVTGLSATGDLLLDADAGKLYVTLMNEGKVIEINTDGTQQRDFVTGLGAPDELALDAKRRTMYITCSGNGTIQRVKLDDRLPQTIVMAQGGVFFGLAVDPTREQLYGIHAGRGMINRTSLDGSEAKQIVSGLTAPDGLALDADNNKLYWTERGKISQANLDGSNVETLVTDKVSQYGSIVVLPPKE
jgi:sugar lactone lactonase YvrE